MWLINRDEQKHCSHPRSERSLCMGEVWYRICSDCGAVKPDGDRVKPPVHLFDHLVHANIVGLSDKVLRGMED